MTKSPEVGTIIDFEYRWARDARSTETEAAAERPCLIWGVQSVYGIALVALLPISVNAVGARVPIKTAELAALSPPRDAQVVIEEANIFLWPSQLIATRGGSTEIRHASRELIATISVAMKDRSLTKVVREEAPPGAS